MAEADVLLLPRQKLPRWGDSNSKARANSVSVASSEKGVQKILTCIYEFQVFSTPRNGFYADISSIGGYNIYSWSVWYILYYAELPGGIAYSFFFGRL